MANSVTGVKGPVSGPDGFKIGAFTLPLSVPVAVRPNGVSKLALASGALGSNVLLSVNISAVPPVRTKFWSATASLARLQAALNHQLEHFFSEPANKAIRFNNDF